MASISSHDAHGGKLILNPNGKTHYLADSDEITQCTIKAITPYRNDEYNLNVEFFKIEPLGNGEMGINALKEPTAKVTIEELMKEFATEK